MNQRTAEQIRDSVLGLSELVLSYVPYKVSMFFLDRNVALGNSRESISDIMGSVVEEGLYFAFGIASAALFAKGSGDILTAMHHQLQDKKIYEGLRETYREFRHPE